MNNHQICSKCIMDTTDPEIEFDEEGVCNHCRYFEHILSKKWYPDERGQKLLDDIVKKIQREGSGRKYDCILGLSGGVDSSYLALKAVELGLRPLALHVDAGWNSELAVQNINKICQALQMDLITEVIDWEEMKDLQLAFLKSGVPNQDIPQDHAFFATLYNYAVKNNIKYILSGSNYATECVLPKSWGYNAMDSWHLKAIHKRFGKKKLKLYPTVGFFMYHIYIPYVKKIEVVKLLNYIPYSKEVAIKELETKIGWQYYGGKHYESRFTKFFQAYYLPTRFGFDKRKAHLSSMIVTGLITREEALNEMKKELYPPDELAEDKSYILERLGITEEEFEKYMTMPIKSHYDYPTNQKFYEFLRKIYHIFKNK